MAAEVYDVIIGVDRAAVKPEEKKTRFPTAYTILALLILLVAILTFVIPAGRYQTDEDGAPIPGTYEQVESNPQRLTDAIMAPVAGMYGIQAEDGSVNVYNEGALYGAINVALFVLIIGGFLGVTMKTGTIDAGMAWVVNRLGKKGNLLIIMLMLIFAAGGSSYGMAEESLAFYPLIIAAMIALGFDALTGVAVVMLGAGIGTLGSTVNPFATGIASGFAGISLGEGFIYRLIILILGIVLGAWFVLRYANKVKKDPARSLVAPMKDENEKHFLRKDKASEAPALTGRRKAILLLFALSFVVLIISVIPWSDLGITFIPTMGWWFGEFSALFLVAAIIIGIVGRLGEKGFVDTFIDGARDLLGVALVVGLARGISVVMNNGLVIDTILNAFEQTLASMKAVAFINTIFLLYLPLSFLIPSSSGLATVSMPIMAPLGGFANVPEHLIVTAYQSASGLINLMTPTFAVVAGGLAIGRVPISTWWRFVLPLVLLLGVMVMVVLSVGVLTGQ